MNSFFSFLLIAGVVQGFVFILFTFLKGKKVSKVILYLNLLVLFLSLNNLQAWLIDNGFSSDIFFIKQFKLPWYLLLFPMFYLFLLNYLNVGGKLKSFLFFSLATFFVEVLIRSALILHSFYFRNLDDSYILLYTNIEEIFNAIFGILIVAKSVILVFKQPEKYSFILLYDDIRWIKIFLHSGMIIISFWVFAIVIFNTTGNTSAYLPLRLGTSILLYWIGYQGFFRYKIVKDRIALRSYISGEKLIESPAPIPKSLSNNKHENDFRKINEHIVQNQRFLDSSLTMNIVAEEVSMSTSHLSKIVNGYSDHNFSDYINLFRIEQAKKLLSDPEFDNYTIAAIGLECGFNSKSTFYSAFKKFTSFTPTEFRHKK